MTAASRSGRFITFEGGEGAGKSTQIALLAEFLKAKGVDCVTTREPGGTPAAEAVRRLLVTGARDRWDGMSELLLNYAARRDHVERRIKPALGEGKWVLSDRFADSSIVYQGVMRQLGKETVEALHALVIDDFWPDLTFLLDLPAGDGLARAKQRDGDKGGRFERLDRAEHEAIRQGFLDLAAALPARIVVVDATREKQEVAAQIARRTQQRFAL